MNSGGMGVPNSGPIPNAHTGQDCYPTPRCGGKYEHPLLLSSPWKPRNHIPRTVVRDSNPVQSVCVRDESCVC